MRLLRLGLGLTRLPINVTTSFTPASLFSGAQGAWYDPSDLSTMFQDIAGTTPVTTNGQLVGKLLDKSGNGNHLVANSNTERPTWGTDGTHSWIAFNGIAQYLQGGDVLDLGTNGYFGCAATRLGSGANQGVFGKDPAAASASRYALFKDSGTLYSAAATSANVAVHKTVAYSATTDAILTTKLDKAGTNRLRINGVTQAPDTTFSADAGTWNTAYNFYLGTIADATGTAASGTYLMSGRLYGLILKISATPSDTDISKAEAWLAAKSGVTL